jgi:hypothetical protein
VECAVDFLQRGLSQRLSGHGKRRLSAIFCTGWAMASGVSKLEEVVGKGSVFDDLVISHDFPAIGQRTMLIPVSVREPLVLMQIEDTQEHLSVKTHQ